MSFIEVQFPTDISFGAVGGAMYSTDIISTYSGHEQRNINWNNARGKWNVAYGVKTPASMQLIIAFFRARQGRAIGFRFKDWTDYDVVLGNLGVGNGTKTIFQLRKQYISGNVIFNRIINKPVIGSLKIYQNGILKTSGVSMDSTTGLVTLAPAPANGVIITADFEFDVPVRFDTDNMNISADAYQTLSWNDISVVELRI